MSFERGTFFCLNVYRIFFGAAFSAFRSRFFYSTALRKKELRSSRAANPIVPETLAKN